MIVAVSGVRLGELRAGLGRGHAGLADRGCGADYRELGGAAALAGGGGGGAEVGRETGFQVARVIT